MLAGRSLPHALMMMIPEAYARPRRPLRRAQGLLRLPLVPHGAVGRAGRGRLHRRPRRRRHARPQRAAPGPLGRDQRRLRRARLGDRRARRSRRTRSCARAAWRRASSSWSTSSAGRIVEDGEIKREVAAQPALRRVVRASTSSTSTTCRAAPARAAAPSRCCTSASSPSATRRRTCGSCSRRWRPRARSRSARWATTPRWRCSRDRRPPLFSYFKQLFAQVTNPPIDPIRESVVMSLGTGVGRERNLLDETPEHAHQLVMAQPILRNGELEKLRQVDHDVFQAHTLDITWPVARRRRAACSARWTPRSATRPTDAIAARREHPHPLRPRRRAGARRRSRRCWRWPRCTTTSCARARACRPASCSSPASRARSTTSRR